MQNNTPQGRFIMYDDEPAGNQAAEQPAQDSSTFGDTMAREGRELLTQHLPRTLARGLETLVNIPEGVAKLGIGAANLGLKGSNLMLEDGEKPVEMIKYPEALEDLGGKLTGAIGKALPEGTLKAQTPAQEISDDIVSDLTSFLTPIPILGGVKKGMALAMAGVGSLSKWLSKKLGASENEATGMKIASQILTAMAGKGALNATKTAIYGTRDNSIKQGLKHGIDPHVENKLFSVYSNLEEELSKAGAPSSERYKFIEGLASDVKKNLKPSIKEAEAIEATQAPKAPKVKEQPFQAPSTYVIKPPVTPVAAEAKAVVSEAKPVASEAKPAVAGKKNIIYKNGKMEIVPYNEPIPETPVNKAAEATAEATQAQQPAKKAPATTRIAQQEVRHAKQMQKQALDHQKQLAKAAKEQAKQQANAEASLKKEATKQNKMAVEAEKVKTKAAEKAAKEAKEEVKRLHKEAVETEKAAQKELREAEKAQEKAKPQRKEKIHISELLQLKSDLNKKIVKGIPKEAQHEFNKTLATVKEMIDEYGKRNPTFAKTHAIAEDIHMGLEQASTVNSFLQKHVTPTRLALGTGALLFGNHAFGVHMPYSWEGLSILAGTRFGLRGAEAYARSSSIRSYYTNVIKAAANKDVPVMLKEVAKLDRAVRHSEQKEAPKGRFRLAD